MKETVKKQEKNFYIKKEEIMALFFNQSFVLKGKNGQKVVFSAPYLNDEKELEFKFCSFFYGRVLVNRKKKAIELHSKKKKVFLLLKGENEKLFEVCLGIRKAIIDDLHVLTQNFRSGKEPIYAIESGNEQYPFLITTPTVLENGRYSIKYEKGLLFFLHDTAKKAGKEIDVTDYEHLLKIAGKALAASNLGELESGELADAKYYIFSLDKLIELL